MNTSWCFKVLLNLYTRRFISIASFSSLNNLKALLEDRVDSLDSYTRGTAVYAVNQTSVMIG